MLHVLSGFSLFYYNFSTPCSGHYNLKVSQILYSSYHMLNQTYLKQSSSTTFQLNFNDFLWATFQQFRVIKELKVHKNLSHILILSLNFPIEASIENHFYSLIFFYRF